MFNEEEDTPTDDTLKDTSTEKPEKDTPPEKESPNDEPDDTYRNEPVFNISKKEFFNYLRKDRNRMRFGNNSKVSNFMKTHNYRKTFYVKYTDETGQEFLNKVK